MSGGDWDYVFRKFEDVADRLLSEPEPSRRALGKQVQLLAKAMHDIEWVDSSDYGEGDDQEAIMAALSSTKESLPLLREMQQALSEAQAERDALQSECDTLRRIHDKTHQTIDQALAVLTVQKPQLGQSTWRLADDFYKAIQDAIKILTNKE